MSYFILQLHPPPLHRLNFSIYDQGRRNRSFPLIWNSPLRRRPAQESGWLRRQRELAVPATGPDPYARVPEPEPKSYHELSRELLGQYLKSLNALLAAFVKHLTALVMFLVVGVGHCLALPWDAVEEVDFWILGAAALAWWLTGSGAEEELVSERRTEELGFRLVQDVRSWNVAGCYHALRS